MGFSLSQEQQLLKDSVERFVRQKYEFEARCKLVATSEGYSQENWSMMAELGWLAVGFPEDHGGFGGGPVETMIIMEAMGQGLVLEPYLPSIVLGGNLVALGGSEEQKNALLPALGEGNLKLAFAYAERQARFDLFDVETTAKKDGGGYVINGEKGVVFHAATADKIIVSARTAGDSRDENGITLFIVDADAKGLTRRDYGTNDGGQASEVAFENVAVDADAVIGDVDGGYPTIEQVVELAIGALCAEAVGCMDYLKDATNEYLKDPRAIRASARQLPGAAAPHGRHVHQLRGSPLVDVCRGGAIGRRRRCGPRQSHRRRQGTDRQERQVRRPTNDPIAWWHGHDRRAQRRALLQTLDDDRTHFRRPGASPETLHGDGLSRRYRNDRTDL